jgi:3-carboxy-cis,cis-muconate cycloisomerase
MTIKDLSAIFMRFFKRKWLKKRMNIALFLSKQRPCVQSIFILLTLELCHMTATLADSRLLGGLFTTPAMHALFEDRAFITRCIDVEVALAQVQGELGLIPGAVATHIAAHAHAVPLDMDALAAQTRNIGFPIMPLVKQLAAGLGDAGRYVHWGATTQDIMDTAVVLQVRDALALLEADLHTTAGALAQLSQRYRDTPMAGRTHMQHALPITFGYKTAVWLSMLQRHQQRLQELRARVLMVCFAGAAGTLASLGNDGLHVQAQLAARLQLHVPLAPWHTARDALAEAVQWLALVTGSLAKMALDVSLLMSTEIAEVFEPFLPGRGGSSTMPQKRNPVSCEVIISAAKAVRHSAALMLEAMVQDFERATGAWQAEWVALPDAFLYSAGAVAQARFLFSGLQVDVARMHHNLQTTGGLIVAEAVMMGLAPKLGRNVAHDVVYDACRVALQTQQSLATVLGNNAQVSALISREEIAALCDPMNYLGSAPAVVDRVLHATQG